MGDFKKHFENLQEKISSYFVGNDKPLSKKEITLKKWFNLSIVAVLVIISFIVLLFFIARTYANRTTGLFNSWIK